MSKVAHFMIVIAVVVVALAFINALAGYTEDNVATWVVQRVR